MCVLTGYKDEAHANVARVRDAQATGAGTALTFTVRVPPRSAVVHHAGPRVCDCVCDCVFVVQQRDTARQGAEALLFFFFFCVCV